MKGANPPTSVGFHVLCLAGDHPSQSPGPSTRQDRRDIARENHAASSLDPADVRWELASRVQHSLEGGNAAILRPERRRELIAAAVGRGMRPFDANLVIAIVQDAARRGECVSPRKGAGPSRATPNFAAVLDLVRKAEPADDDRTGVMMAAVAVGLVIVMALIVLLGH